MGIVSRISYAVRSKLNALVSSAEDPTETLDYSYERLRDELRDVEKGLADLTAQKKRLEVQRERLAQNVEKHDDQAWEAVKQGRDDLARRALEKKQAKRDQVADIDDQIASLEQTQRDLEEKKDDLETRVEEFRTKKETMKARHEAAQARTRVSEAVTGMDDDVSDVTRAIERAKDQTEEMEARAAAMDELDDRGVLDGPLADDRDRIDRELEAGREDGVESELDALRSEVRGEDADGSGGDAEPVDVDVEGPADEPTEEAVQEIDDEAAREVDEEAVREVDDEAVEEELEAIRDEERA